MSNVEVEPYRSSVSGLRALFACGLTQDFYGNNEGMALVQIEPVRGDVREAAVTGSAGYAD